MHRTLPRPPGRAWLQRARHRTEPSPVSLHAWHACCGGVTQSLTEPWRNRAAARDAIQQIIAVHEHLAPYLADTDTALTEALYGCAGGRSGA